MAVGSGVLLLPNYTEDNAFPASNDRLLMKSLGIQAGVVEAEDFKVSAGTGLQVNVKKGKAFVEQTKAIEESSNTFYNGLYNVLNPIEQNPYNNVEVSAVNPQIAQIILRVYDVGELKIGGSSYARIEWLNGTPNALATEARMKEGVYEGRTELSQSSLRIANVLVPKNATKSSEYYIEDIREQSFRFPLKPSIHASNITAKNNEMVLAEEITVTLPSVVTNPIVGIFALKGESTIVCSSGVEIFGDFVEAKKEVKLAKYQHVILQAYGGVYLIIAGEPKRENIYGANTAREVGKEYEASSTRPVFVTISMSSTISEESGEVIVGGIFVGSLGGAAKGKWSFGFICPPKVKWKVNGVGGLTSFTSNYYTL